MKSALASRAFGQGPRHDSNRSALCVFQVLGSIPTGTWAIVAGATMLVA
jgi:hypothetical protein